MAETQECAFQRARRPEQREARRQAILDAAEAMLAEMPVAEISLRELSRRVGLAKSNVLRYFETREAVFLELLDRMWLEWLDALEARLPPGPAYGPDDLAHAYASTLAERPLLCELGSVLAAVLERNVSVDSVRAFKLRATANQDRLARLVTARLPELDGEAAGELVWLSFTLAAGLWPLANPSPTVRAATDDPCLAHTRVDFAQSLHRGLVVLMKGLLAERAGSA
jgi:AcrR family transcriptional regulator